MEVSGYIIWLIVLVYIGEYGFIVWQFRVLRKRYRTAGWTLYMAYFVTQFAVAMTRLFYIYGVGTVHLGPVTLTFTAVALLNPVFVIVGNHRLRGTFSSSIREAERREL